MKADDLITLRNERDDIVELNWHTAGGTDEEPTRERHTLKLGARVDREVAEKTAAEPDPRARVAHPEAQITVGAFKAMVADRVCGPVVRDLLKGHRLSVSGGRSLLSELAPGLA